MYAPAEEGRSSAETLNPRILARIFVAEIPFAGSQHPAKGERVNVAVVRRELDDEGERGKVDGSWGHVVAHDREIFDGGAVVSSRLSTPPPRVRTSARTRRDPKFAQPTTSSGSRAVLLDSWIFAQREITIDASAMIRPVIIANSLRRSEILQVLSLGEHRRELACETSRRVGGGGGEKGDSRNIGLREGM